MARSGLQARRRADNLQDILDAARELALNEGPGALTLAGVAAKVGLTTPALYHYFDSKTALLRALVLSGIEAEADMLVATATRWRSDEAGILGGVVRAMYDHYRPNLSAFRLIYMHLQVVPSSIGVDDDLIARIHPNSRRIFDALQAVLERGQQKGNVASGIAVRTAAVSAHATAVGLLTMMALAERHNDPLRQGDAALLEATSRILESGIRARPPG